MVGQERDEGRGLIDEGLIVRQILRASSASEVAMALRRIGFRQLFWQTWLPHIVRTWDAMPEGFLEHYYGTDADQHCAVAWAIRRKWVSFTFAEARRKLGRSREARAAERVWQAFGVCDGAVLMTGRGACPSATILTTDRDAEPLLARYGEAIALAAWRLDRMLTDHDGLTAIPRVLLPLSDKQRAALRVQIEHPELSFVEQARQLGISPRMLEKRHAQIARRFGVTSFTSAVVKAVRGGLDLDAVAG